MRSGIESPSRARRTVLLVAGLLFLPSMAASAPSPQQCAPENRPLSLAKVLELVARSPGAAATAARIEAAEADRDQAATRPNPTVNATFEDFTGSGSFAKLGQSESTLSLWQPLEIGGRRQRRGDAAERKAEVERVRGRGDAVVAAETAKTAWIDLLAARRASVLAREGEAVARELLADATRRRAGGSTSDADVDRAAIAAGSAALDAVEATRRERIAAARLVALWGGNAAEADCVDGEFPLPRSIGAERGKSAGSREADASLPSIALAESEVEARRADVASARAEAMPDLQIGAGVRYLADPDDVSLIAGVGLEVPLFDRNEGAIRAAEHRLLEAQSRAAVVRADARGRLFELTEDVESSRQRALALERDIVPAAARAFASLSRAWRNGAASLAETLEARRNLAAYRMQHLAGLAEFHRRLTSYEAATGLVSDRLENDFPAPTAGATASEGFTR